VHLRGAEVCEMANAFASINWFKAVAGMLRAADADAYCRSLAGLLNLTVENDGTCLIAFHRNAPPEVLHHTMPVAVARHYIDRYLAGPYLLDPLLQIALRTEGSAACRFRDATPDRFRSSEYYRQYCERTHLKDEMDYLLRVKEETTLALVVGRRQKMFSKAELDRLRLLEEVLHASMQNIWNFFSIDAHDEKRDDALHRRVVHCFETFGDKALTERERQITQLLLRGHSAKSVARELRIAPGTVMVHKRNLFAKLGISSQYELFSLLINKLESP